MILNHEDNKTLEKIRSGCTAGGVAFLAKILCKIIAYLEEQDRRARRHVW